MEKLLNMFGLTTLKSAELRAQQLTTQAVENALGEKPYHKLVMFTRYCRKYKFKVVAVGMGEAEAMAQSRHMLEHEFNVSDMSEQNKFTGLFIPNVKQSNDLDLLE
tara:strand:- start:635 stop:952 length:318 start_codon:yes stop_codon:yes gene_type:complete